MANFFGPRGNPYSLLLVQYNAIRWAILACAQKLTGNCPKTRKKNKETRMQNRFKWSPWKQTGGYQESGGKDLWKIALGERKPPPRQVWIFVQYELKVKVHTLHIAPLRSWNTTAEALRYGMCSVLKGSRSFTCTPHVHLQSEWAIPAFALPAIDGTHLPTTYVGMEGWVGLVAGW